MVAICWLPWRQLVGYYGNSLLITIMPACWLPWWLLNGYHCDSLLVICIKCLLMESIRTMYAFREKGLQINLTDLDEPNEWLTTFEWEVRHSASQRLCVSGQHAILTDDFWRKSRLIGQESSSDTVYITTQAHKTHYIQHKLLLKTWHLDGLIYIYRLSVKSIIKYLNYDQHPIKFTSQRFSTTSVPVLSRSLVLYHTDNLTSAKTTHLSADNITSAQTNHLSADNPTSAQITSSQH